MNAAENISTGLLHLDPELAVAAATEQGVQRILQTVRSHLDMDVAFVSEFDGNVRHMRHVDAKTERTPIKVGDSIPQTDGYCLKVIEGMLPELIPDTSKLAEALEIPDTRAIPIGSHLSVPLRLRDGRVYGTFCCFSFDPNITLNQRDLHMMRVFADLVAHQIDSDIEEVRDNAERLTRIQSVLASDQPEIVYQPIYSLADMQMIGAESLSRFRLEPTRSPDAWFKEATEVALNVELELKAVKSALSGFQEAWRTPDCYLALNTSPTTILSGRIVDLLQGYPARRIVLEITEHDHVDDYDNLAAALKPVRELGVRVAIDDAGSGYASMRHILNIRPDIIKLDISLTRDIDKDRIRRALASALNEFGRQTECDMVAEGVETIAEMETLRSIGFKAAQGYHLAGPMPFAAFRKLLKG